MTSIFIYISDIENIDFCFCYQLIIRSNIGIFTLSVQGYFGTNTQLNIKLPNFQGGLITDR